MLVMTVQVTKAIIPAAGLGTRFLPATKAMPKEMLPVVDKPAIQYVVEEAAKAGLTDVLMVTGRNKAPLENHFDRVAELEDTLAERGDLDKLARVQEATALADVHYLRQGNPLGLGHAVLRARQHVGGVPFAVLLGDDIVYDDGRLLRDMIAVQEATGASVIAVQEVDPQHVSSYGVIAPLEDDGKPAAVEPPAGTEVEAVRVARLVEKPPREEAPSNLAIIGRYVLRPEVFDVLEHTGKGRGGEIQLTDALQELAEHPAETGGVIAVVSRARRFDTGNKLEYLKANVELASEHDSLGPAVRAWLRSFTAALPGD